jgi:hypothetical protein
MFGLLLNPDDGGDTFLQDVSEGLPNYKTYMSKDRTLHGHPWENLK